MLPFQRYMTTPVSKQRMRSIVSSASCCKRVQYGGNTIKAPFIYLDRLVKTVG